MLAFEHFPSVEVVDVASGKVLHVAADQFRGWSSDGRTLAVEVWNHTFLHPIDLVDARTGVVRTGVSSPTPRSPRTLASRTPASIFGSGA
jgi:hypothetical protein